MSMPRRPSAAVASWNSRDATARAVFVRVGSASGRYTVARTLEFDTLSAGRLTGSARKIVAHALVHGVRHWAQLATILRQQGRPTTGWQHDLLLSDAMA